MLMKSITVQRGSGQVSTPCDFSHLFAVRPKLPPVWLDIREATRDAVRHMIAFLGAEYGLDRVKAYMLCSVAGDLRMHEVVRSKNSSSLFYSLSP